MTKVVKFKGEPVPIYVEVICSECGPAPASRSGPRRSSSVHTAVVVNNEIGQLVCCPNCSTNLVVTTEAVVVRLLEENHPPIHANARE
jgi:hypothetical protein